MRRGRPRRLRAGTHVDEDRCVRDASTAFELRVATTEISADGYSKIPVLALGRNADGSPSAADMIVAVSRPGAGTFTPALFRLGAMGTTSYFVPCSHASARCTGPFEIRLFLASDPSTVVATTGRSARRSRGRRLARALSRRRERPLLRRERIHLQRNAGRDRRYLHDVAGDCRHGADLGRAERSRAGPVVGCRAELAQSSGSRSGLRSTKVRSERRSLRLDIRASTSAATGAGATPSPAASRSTSLTGRGRRSRDSPRRSSSSASRARRTFSAGACTTRSDRYESRRNRSGCAGSALHRHAVAPRSGGRDRRGPARRLLAHPPPSILDAWIVPASPSRCVRPPNGR